MATGDVIEGVGVARDTRRLGIENISHRRLKIEATIVGAAFKIVDGPSLSCSEEYRRLKIQPTIVMAKSSLVINAALRASPFLSMKSTG